MITKIILIILYIIILISKIITNISTEDTMTITNIVTLIPLSLIETLIVYMPFWLLKHAWIKTNHDIAKENLSKVDFVNDKKYYRDILKIYSPLQLSYIDNFKIDTFKDIIGTLLNLQLKNKIKINNNAIEIIDSNENNLKENERYVLNHIYNGKVTIDNMYELINIVHKECMEDNLIKQTTKNKSKDKKKLIIAIIIDIILLTIYILITSKYQYLMSNVFIKTISNILPIIVFVVFGIYIPYLIIKTNLYDSLKFTSNNYCRSPKGEEINIKIEGLKNFIKEYSALNTKEYKELNLWDEYIIYSIIFNINKNIVDDLSKLIIADLEEVYYHIAEMENNGYITFISNVDKKLLKDNTPLELSYIHYSKNQFTKDIIATLLDLERKCKILIKNNYIKIIDANLKDLTKSEKYIINNIKNGKVTIYNSVELQNIIEQDLKDKHLIQIKEPASIEEKKEYNKVSKHLIITTCSMTIIGLSLCLKLPSIQNFIPVSTSEFLGMMTIPFCIYLILIAITFDHIAKTKILDTRIINLTTYSKRVDTNLTTFKEYIEKKLDKNPKNYTKEQIILSIILNMSNNIINELSSLVEIIN